MSSPEQQVERLNALLAKVQKNRRRPVGLAPMAALGTSTPANTTGAAAVASRFAPPQPPAASPTRARKLTPAEPITAAVAAPPTPVREEMPEKMPEAPRRPAPPAARPVSPLENALSGEVEREERAAAPRAPAVEAPMRTGTAPRSQRPPAPAPEVGRHG